MKNEQDKDRDDLIYFFTDLLDRLRSLSPDIRNAINGAYYNAGILGGTTMGRGTEEWRQENITFRTAKEDESNFYREELSCDIAGASITNSRPITPEEASQLITKAKERRRRDIYRRIDGLEANWQPTIPEFFKYKDIPKEARSKIEEVFPELK